MVAVGSRLGPYEILAPIGAGGMGEVFRARDTRLDRSVAIKILPADLAQNAQFKTRFEREARTISQLNHPHICTLYDVGENYLVMELLEGESLADRLARGPLALADVLKYGRQIAEALEKAHRAGIVHRDLKPGNVMLTKGGAKLLDFGLAKSAGIAINLDGATQQKPLTQEGTILGTFQYMAPEQLEGIEADARTDIFALGELLYEMSTGKRAFEGSTKTSLIAAIVSGQPKPMSELQPLAPRGLEHVVMKCLEKDPDARWQSAHDIAEELRWIGEGGSGVMVAPERARRRILRRAWLWGGWLAAAGVAAAALWFFQRSADSRRVIHLEVTVPRTISGVDRGGPALSPNGLHVAILTAEGVHLRDLSTGGSRLLAGTEGASFLFWSPNSRSIGFFAGAKLKTIAIDTGSVLTLCDAPAGRGGTWNRDGVILFAPNIATPIYRISEGGGTPAAVTKGRPQWTHRMPEFLHDGRHFVYSAQDLRSASFEAEQGGLFLGSLDGSVNKMLLGQSSMVVLSGDYLLYARSGDLVAQRWDARSLALTGAPIPIAQNIDWYRPRFVGAFSVAGDVLMYRRSTRAQKRVAWLGRDGAIAPIGEPAYLTNVRVARDGKRAVVERYDPGSGTADLHVIDLGSGVSTRASFIRVQEVWGTFSPDSSRIAAASFGGFPELWIQPASGGSVDRLWRGTDAVEVTDWSKDGKYLVITFQRPDTGIDVEYVTLADRAIHPLLRSKAQERSGVLSPDNRWLAYASDESGRYEIYVTRFPTGEGKWQVSSAGGSGPKWSPDGKQLFFIASTASGSMSGGSSVRGTLSAVDVRTGATLESGRPRDIAAMIEEFDMTDDGRIVTLQRVDEHVPPLEIVLNWKQLLKR